MKVHHSFASTGGEIRNPLDICQQDYLHKWLRARSWDVDRALSAITKHAEWRAANMPTGKVDEVSRMSATGQQWM
jgi:hypothetical protein